jgi:hypothetical protein
MTAPLSVTGQAHSCSASAWQPPLRTAGAPAGGEGAARADARADELRTGRLADEQQPADGAEQCFGATSTQVTSSSTSSTSTTFSA